LTNEQYLIVSYFVCAVLSVAAGLLVYLYLRRPFAGVADAASRKNLPSILKRLFPCGLIFPALLGFLSVSYQGCGKSYADIVASRGYLVAKNQEQLSAILFYVVVAILFWNLIALLILRSVQKDRSEH
jgi:H+/Cl- antiporter ClcA